MFSKLKWLIQDGNKIKKWSGNEYVTIGNYPPTISHFINHGVEILTEDRNFMYNGSRVILDNENKNQIMSFPSGYYSYNFNYMNNNGNYMTYNNSDFSTGSLSELGPYEYYTPGNNNFTFPSFTRATWIGEKHFLIYTSNTFQLYYIDGINDVTLVQTFANLSSYYPKVMRANKEGNIVVIGSYEGNFYVYERNGNTLSLLTTLTIGGVAVDCNFNESSTYFGLCTKTTIKMYKFNGSSFSEKTLPNLPTGKVPSSCCFNSHYPAFFVTLDSSPYGALWSINSGIFSSKTVDGSIINQISRESLFWNNGKALMLNSNNTDYRSYSFIYDPLTHSFSSKKTIQTSIQRDSNDILPRPGRVFTTKWPKQNFLPNSNTGLENGEIFLLFFKENNGARDNPIVNMNISCTWSIKEDLLVKMQENFKQIPYEYNIFYFYAPGPIYTISKDDGNTWYGYSNEEWKIIDIDNLEALKLMEDLRFSDDRIFWNFLKKDDFFRCAFLIEEGVGSLGNVYARAEYVEIRLDNELYNINLLGNINNEGSLEILNRWYNYPQNEIGEVTNEGSVDVHIYRRYNINIDGEVITEGITNATSGSRFYINDIGEVITEGLVSTNYIPKPDAETSIVLPSIPNLNAELILEDLSIQTIDVQIDYIPNIDTGVEGILISETPQYADETLTINIPNIEESTI